ncbi:MAG: hypothetical protein ACI93R_002938 [Flavobacteriales bacterium]|jgi:hypothetical protein
MIPVYIALVEIRPLPGCKIDPVEFNGACVRCYIPAEEEVTAQNQEGHTLQNTDILTEEASLRGHALFIKLVTY